MGGDDRRQGRAVEATAGGRGLPANRHCPDGIGLVVFDLDGTVLNHGFEISARVLDAFDAARERGCVLAVSSGRPACMVPREIRRLPSVEYLITVNGANVRRDGVEAPLYHRPMARELVREVIDQARPFDPGWSLFLPDRAAFEWKGFSYLLGDATRKVTPRDVGRRFIRAFAGIKNVRSIENVLAHTTQPVDKLGCSFPGPELCDKAWASLDARGDLEIARMGVRELEITAAGVTKGGAVAWLAEELGVGRSRTVAFGDSGNDLSMVDAVGCFVAMGNATDEVKAAADDITATIDDDGVAVWLEEAMDGRQ